MNRSRPFMLFALLACSLLLAACTPQQSGNDVRGQITGNQGVLLALQNNEELDHLYLLYGGNEAPIGDRDRDLPTTPGTQTSDARGSVVVGELNLLIHNIGQSASAGGIFISGYDPNLITVQSRAGQDQIRTEQSDQTCLHDIIIDGDRYDALIFCEKNDGTSWGVRVDGNDGRDSQTVTFGGLALDDWADKILSGVTGENVDWFSKNGFFGSGRFEVTNQDGKIGVRMMFGNPSADPNRALRGFLLLNMLYGEISGCDSNCRMFPPRFESGQVLLGISDESPQGDALYLDYDIILNREKWPALLNELPQTLQVTACYYYTTTLTPTVCVDPDPGNNRGDPCSASPLVFKQTQGAPIAITRIDQKGIPGGTLFTIHLKHVGNGRFWEPGSLPLCGPYSGARPDARREEVVHLLDARMAGEFRKLDCSPKNSNGYGTTSIRFQNGVAQVNCAYKGSALTSRQAYESAMTLEFGYLYQNSITKKVVIHRT